MGYCERCGGTYDFEGLCEGCGTDEEWSWNTPKNTRKIKCKHCGYDIYEVRRHCHICGAKNDLAFKKGDSYCPKCGNAFEDGICPNCGKTYEFFKNRKFEPIDLRYCPKCGTETSRNDSFCIDCGNENYINEPSKTPVRVSARIAQKTAPKRDVYQKEEPQKYQSYDLDDFDDEDKPIELNTTLWIVLGVLSSLFCCFISGIVSTVFAVRANTFKKRGKFFLASSNLEKAEGWFALTIIIAVIEIVVGSIAALIIK